MAFILINKEYAYWPTVGALLGKEAQHEVDSAQLTAAQADYKKTRQLPDEGFTIDVKIPGTVSGFAARNAYIWLPPAWVGAPTPHLPVLELLVGFPGDPVDWTRAGFADETGSAYAAAHNGVAPIIVMPDPAGVSGADTECVNGPHGNAETYLTVDVPAFARKTFLAADNKNSLAIAGFSAGGMCALMFTLRHPDVYSAFGDFAGDTSPFVGEIMNVAVTIQQLFAGSTQQYQEHDPLWLLKNGRYPDTAGWFEVGSGDAGAHAAQQMLVPLARQAGVLTCARVVAGGHSYALAAQALRDSFPFLAWRLGLGPDPPDRSTYCSGG
jgi:pimeloyl-ACP methyl ester carboxylesterase